MLKKQWILIAIILLVISISAVFIITSLTGISTPTVTVEIDAVQLTEDNVNLDISLELDNQNSYDLVLEDFKIEAITKQDTIIGVLTFPQKTVHAHEKITINTTGSFGFQDEPLGVFNAHITGDFGVRLFGFFSLSLPLNITVITNPTPVIDAVLLPAISLEAKIAQVNETGVLFNGTILVHNQNDFSISLLNPEISINHNETTLHADVSVSDTVITPQSMVPIPFSAFVGYKTFDVGMVSAALSGDVKIGVAGIDMTRPFTATAQVTIPDIADFLMDDERIVIALAADFDTSLAGLSMDVGFRLYNPTKIPLTASELEIIVYRVDNDSKTLIAQDVLRDCPLPGKNETCLKTTFNLPLLSFLPFIGDGIPDWFLLSIIGDFTIADSNQKIPVQLNGYISGNILGTDDLTLNTSQ